MPHNIYVTAITTAGPLMAAGQYASEWRAALFISAAFHSTNGPQVFAAGIP